MDNKYAIIMITIVAIVAVVAIITLMHSGSRQNISGDVKAAACSARCDSYCRSRSSSLRCASVIQNADGSCEQYICQYTFSY